MVVVAIEDREHEADERRAEVALEVLAVRVADEEVDRLGGDERPEVPEVLARPRLALGAERRRGEQRPHLLFPVLAAVGGEAMARLAAGLEDEARHPVDEVGVAVDGVALAVEPRLAVGHRVDETAALDLERRRDRLAGELGDPHEELVGAGDADRVMERPHRVALLGTGVEGLGRAELLHRQGRVGVERVAGRRDAGAAGEHAELAVGGRVELIRDVGEDGVLDAHEVEHALELAVVADGEAVEAGDDVEPAARRPLPALPEMLEDGLQHVVVARGVAADEGGGVGERDVEVLGHRALVLGVGDERVQVVADDLGHARRRHRDHLGLVELVGVGEPLDHVGHAAEHCGVFGHRRRHRRARLLEVARQVRPVVRDAPLRSVDEAQGLLEAGGGEDRPERLAGLGGVDGQGLALEVLLAILPGFGPIGDRLRPIGGRHLLERLLPGQHLLVVRLAKEERVIENLIG
jgi:hypothetical protein